MLFWAPSLKYLGAHSKIWGHMPLGKSNPVISVVLVGSILIKVQRFCLGARYGLRLQSESIDDILRQVERLCLGTRKG